MVSSRNTIVISGALLLIGCCLVHSYPNAVEDDEVMMNDDYDYDGTDEQSGSSQQTKPSSIAKADVPRSNRTVTKTGILGEDVVLKCDDKVNKDSVILWYKDSTLIANGNGVMHRDYRVDSRNFDLTILKASAESAGDYYCQIVPQSVFVHTKLILGDHSMDVITPESSTSGQSSLHRLALMPFVLFVGLLLLPQYKH